MLVSEKLSEVSMVESSDSDVTLYNLCT